MFALFPAHVPVDNPDVRLLGNSKAVEEKLIFDFDRHLTVLQPFQNSQNSLNSDISLRILFQMAFCFCFLGVPSTVSISRAP
jgi:hypothetical protein